MSIKQAQQRLMSMGFQLPRFGADGDFGAETVNAFNLAMDELAMMRANAMAERPTPQPAPAPSVRRIDPAGFKKFAPKALPGTLDALEAAIAANPPLQDRTVLAHWLGQMFVESQGFSTLVENLNYSVDGLLKTFGRHRISEADAKRLGRTTGRPADQRGIANAVYGGEWGRKNLGNTQPNDGWDMRGSGFKQRTGRYNMSKSRYTAEQLRTDVVAAAMDSADFFIDHKCVAPARADDVLAVTKIVNGGTNGLAERRTATAQAKGIVS